jgi:hypothetical protein
VDMEKALVLLLSTMFVEIGRIANDNTKVPREVVLFGKYFTWLHIVHLMALCFNLLIFLNGDNTFA